VVGVWVFGSGAEDSRDLLSKNFAKRLPLGPEYPELISTAPPSKWLNSRFEGRSALILRTVSGVLMLKVSSAGSGRFGSSNGGKPEPGRAPSDCIPICPYTGSAGLWSELLGDPAVGDLEIKFGGRAKERRREAEGGLYVAIASFPVFSKAEGCSSCMTLVE